MTPAAEPDRRLYAFALDRLVGWGVVAVAAALLVGSDVSGGRVVGVVAVALLVLLGAVLLLGLRGTSPGRAALGLRVVDAGTGAPIGVPRALVRSALLGVATLPTCGLGVAALAWTAFTDPSGRRRGWHDQQVGSVVVDVRPGPDAEPAEPAPQQLVNLTALRLSPPDRADLPLAAPRPPAAEAPTGRWRVDVDTGESFVVEGLTLVGRDPTPRPGEQVARLVPLPSADQSLSKTHAQLLVVPDGALVVLDRGSTNGSVLVRRGASRPLTAHRATTLLADDVVRFGDRTLTVTHEA